MQPLPPYSTISLVLANNPWVWIVTNLTQPNIILLRFWPENSLIVLTNGSRIPVQDLPGAFIYSNGMVDNATLPASLASQISFFVVPIQQQ